MKTTNSFQDYRVFTSPNVRFRFGMGVRRNLLAGVDVINSSTLLAADVAAPVENTVTFLLAFLSSGVVAPTTAQQVTSVDTVGRQVTGAIAGTK